MTQEARRPHSAVVPDQDKVEVAERIFEAFDAFNRKRGRGKELSQADLGVLVARELGLAEPLTQASVSRWMSTTNPSIPKNKTLVALAKVLHTDPAWLLYGVVRGTN